MNPKNLIEKELNESAQVKLDTAKILIPEINSSFELIKNCIKKGGKIIIVGNGGSAADAQHIAADFVGEFRYEIPIPAIALTTDTSILTSLSNDFHFNFVFSKQITAIASPKDVLIAISTSGASKNILEALKAAKNKGLKIIALTSIKDKNMSQLSDVSIKIPSSDIARIQETHICIGHILCHLIKKDFTNYE